MSVRALAFAAIWELVQGMKNYCVFLSHLATTLPLNFICLFVRLFITIQFHRLQDSLFLSPQILSPTDFPYIITVVYSVKK